MRLIAKIILMMSALFGKQKLTGQNGHFYLKNIVSEARDKFGLPALAVVTMDSTRFLETEIQGVLKWNSDDQATIHHFFHIGSCSKSVLAVIAAKLVEQNKIQWHTKFFNVYPELKTTALQDYKDITLEDLILCKAGIKAFTDDREKFPPIGSASQNPRYDFAKWLLTLPPASKFEKGKFHFSYSNAGYTMAALMLEKVSGKNFEGLVKQFIVKELGIEVHIGFPNKFDSLQPWGHTILGKEYKIFPPDHEYEIPHLLLPAGDLSMTPSGFASYVQQHLKGLLGSDDFLSPGSYQYIHFIQKGFALGVYNTKMYGRELTGMDGSGGTFFCRAIIVPKSNFAFVIMTNAGTGTAHMKAIDWISKKIAKKRWRWKL